jgi:hypothetical protein
MVGGTPSIIVTSCDPMMLHFLAQWELGLLHSSGTQVNTFWLSVNHSYATPLQWCVATRRIGIKLPVLAFAKAPKDSPTLHFICF